MSADLERVPLNSRSVTPCGRALSANVRRLHRALNVLLSDAERQQFIHCLNVYHAKRNVFDLVQTLKVILDSAPKRQLLPMLRLVIPRSDQLLFDQYTSEGLYLQADLLLPTNGCGDEGDSALHKYVSSVPQPPVPAPGCPDGFSAAAELAAAAVTPPHFCDGFFGDLRQVTLTRSRSHEGLGFSIRGGAEHGVGIYVSLVEPGSSAEREGLRVGDQIMTANDLLFDHVTHVDAVKVLKGCKKLTMSVCSMGRIPGGFISNQVYSWVDPQGRGVSPPPDDHQGERRQELAMEERTVSLNLDDGRSLGLMIRGGAEYGLGIYVTGVDPGSAADVGSLKVGDQILEVNAQSFVTISHDEAVHILKTGRHLLVRVRDVGRLPHARTVVDETKWICSQAIAESNATANPHASATGVHAGVYDGLHDGIHAGILTGVQDGVHAVLHTGVHAGVNDGVHTGVHDGVHAGIHDGVHAVLHTGVHAGVHDGVHAAARPGGSSSRPSSARATPVLGKPAGCRAVGPPGAQVSLEQQAYMLLTEAERQTMSYYLQEYQGGTIGVEPLTMALFELFNTHAKLSMLTEVRTLVAPQDLELYDRLVLHQECEAPQGWNGGHCSHAPSAAHDGGHAPNAMPCSATALHTAVPVCQADASGTGWTDRQQEGGVTLDALQACSESPPACRAAPGRPSRELSRKPSARLVQPGPAPGPGPAPRLLQDCLQRSLRCLPAPLQPAAPAAHHASLGALHHTCQTSLQLSGGEHLLGHPHYAPHAYQQHTGVLARPGSGHHTCPGFLHHRDSSGAAKPDPPARLSSRSSSYEKSALLSKSASSSKAASPMPSPHLSPCTSPCPSLVAPSGAPCSPDRPCSPALIHKVLVSDMNRLSADSRPQQRGATLSQLSDSGQTLSEDSGVDIAESGGLSKDGSPRPSKTQAGAHGPPTGAPRQLTGSPVPPPTATLVRVVKNANTLGIAIEGGANTRQPLPRIVTIQKGGSAHHCGQLKVGQVILEVNGVPLRGREHKDAARIIAEAFKTKDKDHVDFLVVEPGL